MNARNHTTLLDLLIAALGRLLAAAADESCPIIERVEAMKQARDALAQAKEQA